MDDTETPHRPKCAACGNALDDKAPHLIDAPYRCSECDKLLNDYRVTNYLKAVDEVKEYYKRLAGFEAIKFPSTSKDLDIRDELNALADILVDISYNIRSAEVMLINLSQSIHNMEECNENI